MADAKYGPRTLESIRTHCASRGLDEEEADGEVRDYLCERLGVDDLAEADMSDLNRLNRNLGPWLDDYLAEREGEAVKRVGEAAPESPW